METWGGRAWWAIGEGGRSGGGGQALEPTFKWATPYRAADPNSHVGPAPRSWCVAGRHPQMRQSAGSAASAMRAKEPIGESGTETAAACGASACGVDSAQWPAVRAVGVVVLAVAGSVDVAQAAGCGDLAHQGSRRSMAAHFCPCPCLCFCSCPCACPCPHRPCQCPCGHGGAGVVMPQCCGCGCIGVRPPLRGARRRPSLPRNVPCRRATASHGPQQCGKKQMLLAECLHAPLRGGSLTIGIVTAKLRSPHRGGMVQPCDAAIATTGNGQRPARDVTTWMPHPCRGLRIGEAALTPAQCRERACPRPALTGVVRQMCASKKGILKSQGQRHGNSMRSTKQQRRSGKPPIWARSGKTLALTLRKSS